MEFHAASVLSQETDSHRAGLAAGRSVRESFGSERLATVLVYATVNHDQALLLAGVRAAVGPEVVVVGCSTQGVMSNGAVLEGGYLVGAMGLGGSSLRAAAALAHEIQQDGMAKGRSLARELKAKLGEQPRLLLMVYDPLCGVDVNQLLAGLRAEVSSPLVGGAASQPSGPVAATYQYHGVEAFTRSAVALGLVGPFETELGLCHGTSPTGVVMTLTRADGNKLLELDGRPALDVWRETTGLQEHQLLHQDHTAALAMGIERTILKEGRQENAYLIRAAFGFDQATKAIVVQAAIPEGSKVLFHHRTARVVKDGTAAMARELAARLAGRHTWAVLGFECGARTAPFLGPADTLEENLVLQEAVAPQAPWLGMLPWGEIAPCGDEPAFHNYTYPLVVLTQ
jgi:hypothetical protein